MVKRVEIFLLYLVNRDLFLTKTFQNLLWTDDKNVPLYLHGTYRLRLYWSAYMHKKDKFFFLITIYLSLYWIITNVILHLIITAV